MMFSLTCSVLSNGRKASSSLKSKFLYSDGNQAGIILPTSFVAVQKNIVRVVSRSPFLPRERSSGYHRQDLCCGRSREGGRYVMPSWTVLGVRRPTWVHKSENKWLAATLQYRCRFGRVLIIEMRGLSLLGPKLLLLMGCVKLGEKNCVHLPFMGEQTTNYEGGFT